MTVSKSGTGSGIVISHPAGIACGATCSAFFPVGSRVSLTATPAKDSIFEGWSGDCSGKELTCDLTLDRNRSVVATFRLTGTPPIPACEETDGGKNYNISGTTFVEGYGGFTDYCLGDAKTLVEYYCLEKQLAVEVYTCPHACRGGICLTAPGAEPIEAKVQLPSCPFRDWAGIWAKPEHCDWSTRVQMGSDTESTCSIAWLFHNTVRSWGGGIIFTTGMAGTSHITDLCKIEPVPPVLPACPFKGQPGEVWAKPRFEVPGVLKWTWEMGSCKVGTDCERKFTVDAIRLIKDLGYKIPPAEKIDINLRDLIKRVAKVELPAWLDILISLTLEKGAEIGPMLRTLPSGKVLCRLHSFSVAGVTILSGALPCEFCIVK